MELIYGQISSVGPVRDNNEDCLGFWQPDDLEEQRNRGAAVVVADGVGGHAGGEVASQLAVQRSLETFQEFKPGVSPRQALWQMFTAANVAVYDRGMEDRKVQGRMATTLTIALLRNDEITIGHVGDCRAYLVQEGRVRQITDDHTYAAMQRKLGLISEQEAANSELRCMLMRSMGKDPVVQVDYYTVQVKRGDYLVQCTDGLHQCITEEEIGEIVTHAPPIEACRRMVALAEKRGTEDNLSVQVVQIERVEQVAYYRGLPIYQEAEVPMSHEMEVGQILDSRFHITEVVSRSGMASIFKAQDLKTGATVAVKVPFMQFESDPAFFTRFQREEAIGATLNHPYILHVVPVEEKSRPYIVMEFLKGQTLRQAMRNMQRLPVDYALDVTRRVCEALEYLHQQQVIHRDLKPENIMLCEDGSIRIMDFGIAKSAGLRRLTFTGFSGTMGTPDYMAPEQVKGKRGDARTDLYSLGAMLYEMLTGQVPFEGSNPYVIMNARLTGDAVSPRKLNPEISPQLEEIVLHAMEEKPFNRYASAAEMKADLDNPEKVPLTGRAERLRPQIAWQGNWHRIRFIVFALLLPVVIFGILFLIYNPFWKKH